MESLIPAERIESKIYLIRGQKVMLDRDLAELYGVGTKVLKQAVKRNRERFPVDFMFELNQREFENWRSQFVTSNLDKMGLRWAPFAFTEQGVAMLSSVLHCRRAILVNIQIMRTFVRLKQILATHKDLTGKLAALEKKINCYMLKHDAEIQAIFDAIRKLMESPEKPKGKIGFITGG